ncbi:MAG: rRNA maturation RNase YbeY [Prevotella sp.]|nr:rRNA maturation RNase YbeY [Bacteroidaceae bacterium]MBR6170730.1 rRNA maturation RNase YbeY [Bacteroidaceae bacterium]MBR7017392.1 rRNA maturation RNase YbeY [Prevotella sp.]
MISYNVVNTEMPPINQQKVTEWVRQVAATYRRHVGDINFIFVDDEEILRVNREFIGHDYYTDHIGFDYSQGSTISGDIYIGVDTVRTNSEQIGCDYNEELYRVIIHGVLHLCGIDDKGPGERAIMEAEEDKALELWKNLI